MKLKTLNDIESQFHTPTDNIIGYELRQEAIKWVKEDLRLLNILTIYELKEIAKADIERWMDRFNITKEDLK